MRVGGAEREGPEHHGGLHLPPIEESMAAMLKVAASYSPRSSPIHALVCTGGDGFSARPTFNALVECLVVEGAPLGQWPPRPRPYPARAARWSVLDRPARCFPSLRSPAGATGRNFKFAGFGLTDGIVPPCLRTILPPEWFEGNEISVACACVRIGRACNGPATTLRH